MTESYASLIYITNISKPITKYFIYIYFYFLCIHFFLSDMAKMRTLMEDELKARLMQNDKDIIEMKKSYEDKLKSQKKDISVSRCVQTLKRRLAS